MNRVADRKSDFGDAVGDAEIGGGRSSS